MTNVIEANEVLMMPFAGELRFYASRFQSMRTRLRLVPWALPKQEVVSTGEIALEIVDVPAHDDPAQVAAKLAAWQEDTAFDYEREFPIRMTLRREEGAFTRLVMALRHFATDAVGAMTMCNDYISRDPRTGRAVTPAAMHPLELAARQRAPSALRQSEASLRYWDALLRTIPMSRFSDPVDPAPGSGRCGRIRMNSPAMLLALPAIGNRLGTDVSTVLLGVVSVGVARVAGINPVAAQMMVSNRFRPGFAEMVSNVSQAGLFVVDVLNSAPRWTELPLFNERLMVTTDDEPGAIGLIVLADTAYVPRSRMVELARELESLAVEAARDPDLSTGVSCGVSANASAPAEQLTAR